MTKIALTLAWLSGPLLAFGQLAPITGEIKFGSTGPVALTGGSKSFLTATGFDFFPVGSSTLANNAIVNLGATGSFATLAFPTFAVFKDFTFSPLPLGGVDVWEISEGQFSFKLENVTTVSRTSNAIILSGTGIVTGPGWAPTPGTFYFSTKRDSSKKSQFSFSANTSINNDN